jgi:sugar phosphate isomerase/epimerase
MFTSLNAGAIGLSLSFEESLELARANHFDALDLPLAELQQRADQLSVQKVKDRLAEAGLQVGGWSLPVEFRRDEATYQAGLETLTTQAALAHELGMSRCFTYILPFSDELDYAANLKFHAQRLRPIAQILADHGCRFGLEFVGPKTMRNGHRYDFISTIAGALELGQEIGTNNTGILLDCWHWYTAHDTVAEIDRLSNEQIVYVHVNDAPAGKDVDEQVDNRRLLPGASGVIDIANFLQALQRLNYDGPVVVEPFNAEHAALAAPQRVQATRESLRKISQIAGLV